MLSYEAAVRTKHPLFKAFIGAAYEHRQRRLAAVRSDTRGESLYTLGD